MTLQEAIGAAELAERETADRDQLARQMYQAGWADAEADMAWRRAAAAGPVTHGVSHAELEVRRWGPDGRAHFADPRPATSPAGAHHHKPTQKQKRKPDERLHRRDRDRG
jgi:hypothetical protein